MIGQKFGEWTVISHSEIRSKKCEKQVLCQCACGLQRLQKVCRLVKGDTKECKKCWIKKAKEIKNKLYFERCKGLVFNQWTVLDKGPSNRQGIFLCRCACGEEKEFYLKSLQCGTASKCCKKCRKIELKAGPLCTSKTNEYRIWANIKSRCYNDKIKCYKWYGGRGITMCDAWINSFSNFFNDMGPRPSLKHEIDRIDNDGNYEKTNCRWVLHIDNIRNQRKEKTSRWHKKK